MAAKLLFPCLLVLIPFVHRISSESIEPENLEPLTQIVKDPIDPQKELPKEAPKISGDSKLEKKLNKEDSLKSFTESDKSGSATDQAIKSKEAKPIDKISDYSEFLPERSAESQDSWNDEDYKIEIEEDEFASQDLAKEKQKSEPEKEAKDKGSTKKNTKDEKEASPVKVDLKLQEQESVQPVDEKVDSLKEQIETQVSSDASDSVSTTSSKPDSLTENLTNAKSIVSENEGICEPGDTSGKCDPGIHDDKTESLVDLLKDVHDSNARMLETVQPSPDYRLYRPENVQVGQTEELIADRPLKLTYKSLKPLMYEIEDFLSTEECHAFIHAALDRGMRRGETQLQGMGKNKLKQRPLTIYDLNNDQKLNYSEIRTILENNFDIYFTEKDVEVMLAELDLDPNKDKIVTKQEMEDANLLPQDYWDYLNYYTAFRRHLWGRNSIHAWIFPEENENPLISRVIQRVSKLVRIPMTMMNKSDIQIVKYSSPGHYNCHYDSGEMEKMKCCSRFISANPCRSCRWMTVLFYLTDVDEGGETAFPIADQEQHDEHKFRQEHRMDLNLHCEDSNLLVKPKKGKAIVWWNHFVDNQTGWVGQMDPFGLHGSCGVKGISTKWIANFWIKFSDNRKFDMKFFPPDYNYQRRTLFPPKDEL